VVGTGEGTVVRVEGLTYWYPGSRTPALEGVDLDLRRGELVLLVGASGSGKSTLLRALDGLVPSYYGGRIRGRVRIDGVDIAGRPVGEVARRVGLVFQDPDRQLVMSRVDNEVAFGLESLGVPSQEIGPRVARALRDVGLGERGGDMVTELSAGQAQRLALASVLATEPGVLALDEPTSQLDPAAAERFLELVVQERDRRDVAIIMAEHRIGRCLPFADRVVVLADGRVAFDGDPASFAGGGWEGASDDVLPPLSQAFRAAPPVPVDAASARARAVALAAEGRLAMAPRAVPAPGEVVVACSGVRFSYDGGGEVLRGVDLELRAGEVLALVGPNGAGKSTLARHLNGLLRPSAGRVEVLRADAASRTVAELTRDVAVLVQNPGDFLFERTVENELRLSARLRGLAPGPSATEVARVSDELGLGPHMDAFSWDLSAGQRQRVALGALLVGAPRVLVLDEPTRGMDIGHRRSLATILRGEAARGRAVMVITHDAELAGLAADRWTVMEEGRVVVAGGAEDVLTARPEHAPAVWRATHRLGATRGALCASEMRVLAVAKGGADA
jgi:energy-coupling factor transporter ATP-binding protein EcfA2